MQLIKLGSKNRLINGNWNFVIDGVQLNHQLLHQKREAEVQLNEEILKRKKCEEEVLKLQDVILNQDHKRQYNRKKSWLLILKLV